MAARKKPNKRHPKPRKRVKRRTARRKAAARKHPKRAAKTPPPKRLARAKPARKARGVSRASVKPRRARKPARVSAVRSEPEPANSQALAAVATLTPSAPPSVLASIPLCVGSVTKFFQRAAVALIALDAPIAIGDRLHVRGATSDFLMPVTSLRVGGASVTRVSAGEATLGVAQRARPGDVLYVLRAPV
jgi:hypothetical protein